MTPPLDRLPVWKKMGPVLFIFPTMVFAVIASSGDNRRPRNYRLKETINYLQKGELLEFIKDSQQKFDTKRVLFVLYKKINGRLFRSVGRMEQEGELHDGLLNCKHPFKAGIHGWQQKITSKFAKEMTSAYLDAVENAQVVMVRWYAADQNYLAARLSIPEVASTIYKYLQRITQETCINLGQITLIGHSLGAHLAGTTGNLARGNIGKIIALDPAYPTFWENSSDVVSPMSAQRVIGVHTSPGFYGCDWDVGHVDFWPNLGRTPQPACVGKRKKKRGFRVARAGSRNIQDPDFKVKTADVYKLACSHEESIYHFFRTVRNRGMYLAKKCDCITVETCRWRRGYHDPVLFNEFTKASGQYCYDAN